MTCAFVFVLVYLSSFSVLVVPSFFSILILFSIFILFFSIFNMVASLCYGGDCRTD